METQGVFTPTTVSEAREQYEMVGPAAQTVVKETAKAMDFDSTEYRARVTNTVVETARDALYASLLVVHTGTVEEFESWLADRGLSVDDESVHLAGSPNVDNVAWHPAPDAVVAATFQNEPDAAVGTLRRQAFGRVYAEELA